MADLTLIVEDGSGVVGANSWVSLVEADDLLQRRPHAQDWQELEEQDKQRCLLTACDLLQVLDWSELPAATTLLQAIALRVTTGEAARIGSSTVAAPWSLMQAQSFFARRLAKSDQLEQLDEAPLLGSSTAGRSRSLAAGHPSAESLVPREVRVLIGAYINWHTARLVRAA